MDSNRDLKGLHRRKAFDDILQDICDNTRLCESKNHMQHGRTSVYEHSVSVAYNSYRLALLLKLRINHRELVRGALLHDYFLYDWHTPDASRPLHGFSHPKLALKNAEEEMDLSDIERDIILRHMFPLTPIPPKCVESVLVCLVDKYCSIAETINRSRRK